MSLCAVYYAQSRVHALTHSHTHCQVVIKFSVAYDPPSKSLQFSFYAALIWIIVALRVPHFLIWSNLS